MWRTRFPLSRYTVPNEQPAKDERHPGARSTRRAFLLVSLTVLGLLSACRPDASPAVDTEVVNELDGSVFGFGAGEYNLDDPAVGLEALTSYRAVLTLRFTGARDGRAENWVGTYEVEVSREDPEFRQVRVISAGLSGDEAAPPAFMAEANGLRFEQVGDDACTVEAAAGATPLSETWEPARMLSPLSGADVAGAVEYDHQAASRYGFDARARGEAEWVDSEGQVTVATQGGYVLHYAVTTRGGEDYFGEGVKGALHWEYYLSEVNQPRALRLPANCPEALAGLAPMPDAADFDYTGDVATFRTDAGIEAVMAYYHEQLQALGWGAVGEPQVNEAAGMATYVKGDRQIIVLAAPAGGATAVWLKFEPYLEPIPFE